MMKRAVSLWATALVMGAACSEDGGSSTPSSRADASIEPDAAIGDAATDRDAAEPVDTGVAAGGCPTAYLLNESAFNLFLVWADGTPRLFFAPPGGDLMLASSDRARPRGPEDWTIRSMGPELGFPPFFAARVIDGRLHVLSFNFPDWVYGVSDDLFPDASDWRVHTLSDEDVGGELRASVVEYEGRPAVLLQRRMGAELRFARVDVPLRDEDWDVVRLPGIADGKMEVLGDRLLIIDTTRDDDFVSPDFLTYVSGPSRPSAPGDFARIVFDSQVVSDEPNLAVSAGQGVVAWNTQDGDVVRGRVARTRRPAPGMTTDFDIFEVDDCLSGPAGLAIDGPRVALGFRCPDDRGRLVTANLDDPAPTFTDRLLDCGIEVTGGSVLIADESGFVGAATNFVRGATPRDDRNEIVIITGPW